MKFEFEDHEIGDTASRASGVIFFVLCSIPILSTVLYGGVDTGTWTVISVLAGIIALTWLVDAWLGKGILINRSTLLLPLAGLIAIGFVQLLPFFSSGLPTELLADQSRQPLSMDPYATRFFLVRLIVYLVFFAAALTYLNTERRLKKVTIGLVLFGALVSFFGILQWLAKPEAIYGLRETPNAVPFGPFVNQHHFAAFTEMGFGLALGLLAGKGIKRDKMLLVGVGALMLIVAALLTSSRGGFISYAGILSFVLIVRYWSRSKGGEKDASEPPKKLILVIAPVLAAVVVILGVVVFVGGDTSLMRGAGLADAPADVSNGRIHFWTTALKIFAEHPILGAGYDAFGVAFTRLDTWNGIFRIEQAHNDYLQTLADAGIVGFVCVAAFIFLLFKKGLKVIANTSDGFRSSVAIGALAGCVGILIHSFFDFPLRTPANAFIFLLLAAVATVSIKSTETPKSSRR